MDYILKHKEEIQKAIESSFYTPLEQGDNITKGAWSVELMKKNPGSRWVTIRGSKVLLGSGGEILASHEGLKAKLEERGKQKQAMRQEQDKKEKEAYMQADGVVKQLKEAQSKFKEGGAKHKELQKQIDAIHSSKKGYEQKVTAKKSGAKLKELSDILNEKGAINTDKIADKEAFNESKEFLESRIDSLGRDLEDIKGNKRMERISEALKDDNLPLEQKIKLVSDSHDFILEYGDKYSKDSLNDVKEEIGEMLNILKENPHAVTRESERNAMGDLFNQPPAPKQEPKKESNDKPVIKDNGDVDFKGHKFKATKAGTEGKVVYGADWDYMAKLSKEQQQDYRAKMNELRDTNKKPEAPKEVKPESYTYSDFLGNNYDQPSKRARYVEHIAQKLEAGINYDEKTIASLKNRIESLERIGGYEKVVEQGKKALNSSNTTNNGKK